MAFRNQLLTLLQIFQTSTGKLALLARGGANSQGFGQAVLQLYTDTVGEKYPAELTAYDGGSPGIVLDLHSPGQNTDPTLHRAYLDLYGAAGAGRTNAILAGDNLQLTSSDDPAGCVLVIQAKEIDAGGPIYGTTSAAPAAFGLPPDLHTSRSSVTPTGNLAARAGYGFAVSQLGQGHAVLQGQLQATGAVTSPATIVAAGGLPTWARPPVIVTLPVTGAVGVTAGASPSVEIHPDGSVVLWAITLANGNDIGISGCYPVV